MVGAHASFTLSDETLAACVDTARDAGVGVHIHVAEDAADQRDAEARCGQPAVERLHAAGVVDERALLAHCVHVGDAERRLVAGMEATVVCNPRSNMNNGVGYSPFNLGGDRVALGTDGIDGDMFAESRSGFFRAREADLGTAPGWPLSRLAESARFVGRVYGEPEIGTLRPGAPADVAVLDYPHPTPFDGSNVAGHWVFGLTAAHVRDVYVAGELVVAGGRSTRVDEAEVAARSTVETERLWARLETVPPHPYTPRGDHH
jgi:cytosine/adenosine deaminase-related metal-dependent hydrolase